jgi:hypothetical protein
VRTPRTALFGGLRGGVELLLVGAGDLHGHIQVYGGDGEPGVGLIQSECRGSVDAFRSQPGRAELSGERHAETSGVRGRDQFLGVRSDAVLKTGAEGILRVLEHAALR